MKKIWLLVVVILCVNLSVNAQEVFEAIATINNEEKVVEMVEIGDKYYINIQDLIDSLPKNISIKEGNIVINTEQTYKDTNNKNQSTQSSGIIESRIDGEFNGWTSDTLFKLTNGQIWKQAEYSYKYAYKYSPKVFIANGTSGWVMVIEGIETPIRVIRIK